MKTSRVFAAVLSMVLGTASLNAATPCDEHTRGKLAKAERNYVDCLSSDNYGVVESGLALVAQMKLRYPEIAFSRLNREVGRLVLEGSTPVIRYKAAIVSAVLNNPALFAAEGESQIDDGELLLYALASKLQAELASNVER